MQKVHDPLMEQKREVLARFLGVDCSVLRESSGSLYTFKAFFHGNNEAYLVLTDAEATLAAEHAVSEKLWLISLETLFAYFDINAYPSDVLSRMKINEIRHANKEIRTLIHNTCGLDTVKNRMLACGNRKNLLADYDQAEHFSEGFFIYRLY